MNMYDHIYGVPECYVGSTDKVSRNARVYSDEGVSLVRTEVPVAMESIFQDVLSLVEKTHFLTERGDNPRLTVSIKGKLLTVRFSGHLPIVQNEDGWVPSLVFSNLLADHTDTKFNGCPFVCANIFSKYFRIYTVDGTTGKTFEQLWENNIRTTSGPSVYDTDQTNSYTLIEYVLDFERFGYDSSVGYTEDIINLYLVKFLDVVMVNKLSYSFTYEIGTTSITYESDTPMDLLRYVGNNIATEKDIIFCDEDKDFEFVAYHTPGRGQATSFVNGIYTSNGGGHVDYLYMKIRNILKQKGIKLSMKEIKNDITVFVNYTVRGNIWFGNQSKDILIKPTPKYALTESTQEKILSWYVPSEVPSEVYETTETSETQGFCVIC